MPVPDVSIVIPVRNGATVLPICLEAIRRQNCQATAFDVIVVDDGSTDATLSVARCIAAEWETVGGAPRLRVISQGWLGSSAARNAGMREARAQIVLFTDADCEPVPQWVSAMLAAMSDPSVAAALGAYLTKQRSAIARLVQAEWEDRYRLLAKRSAIDVVFTHSAAFRRQIVLDAGGFDESMSNDNEDTELSYRLASAGHRMVFAPGGRVYHRHSETLWDYVRKKFGRGYWRMLVYKRYPMKAARDSYTPQSLKVQILCLLLAALSAAGALLLQQTSLVLLTVASLAVLLATTFPFAWRLRGPLALRVTAPLFLTARAAALGAGTVRGLLGRIEDHAGGRRQ